MKPVDARGAALSAQRAFVVHLGAGGGTGRRRFRGRIEHLSSGASTHFSSLKGLLAFFAPFLDPAPQEAGNRWPGSERSTAPGPRRRAV